MDFPDPKYREACSNATLQSSKQGFFSSLGTALVERVGQEWIENVFGKEKLEEDKIRICCKEKKVWREIKDILQNVKPIYREKSASAARESRIEGDKLYKEGNYKKAAMLYSQSVIRAPRLNVNCSIDEGLTLPIAYKCRANALFKLEMFKECLVDLQLTLKEGYPRGVCFEIYERMAHCHKELNDEKKAKISLELALTLLNEHIAKMEKTGKEKNEKGGAKEVTKRLIGGLRKKREEMKKLLADMKEGKCLARVIAPPALVSVGGPLPEVTESGNERFPNASQLLTVKQELGSGRFTAAARDIPTGAVLVVEEPFASFLIPEMFSSHCHHCYSKLYSSIPCNVCAGVAFCGTECRDAALSSYHKYECPFMGLFIGSGMSVLSFLSLRMVTQESLSFFKALHAKIKSIQSGEEKGVTFTEKEKNYLGVYNLVTHSNLRENADYFQRVFMAIFLVKCLKKTDYFGDEKSKGTEELSEDEILTAALFLRHLQVLQFNAHEIYETKVEKVGKTKGSKSVYIAVGVYPTVALFNHECSLNVVRYFHGRKIVIRAARPIKKGEPVSENYGPIFTKRTLTERTRELTSRYWFKCKCVACIEDWPTMDDLSEEHFKLRCKTPQCSGLLPYPEPGSKTRKEPLCPRCFNKVDLAPILDRVSKVEVLFERGIERMDDGDCEEAVSYLTAFLDEIYKLGVPPSREISLGQEALRTCYAQMGNVWICD